VRAARARGGARRRRRPGDREPRLQARRGGRRGRRLRAAGIAGSLPVRGPVPHRAHDRQAERPQRAHRPPPGVAWPRRAGSQKGGRRMRDFSVSLSHRPGELARVAKALSRYGVNLKSVTGQAMNGQVQVRFLPDDVDAARSALQASDIRFEEHEVATVLLENRAGELANLADKLGAAHVNILALYGTGAAANLVEVAVVPDDMKKAKKVLESA